MHVRSAEAQGGLESIEASIGDLVPFSRAKKSKVQMVKSWDFGPSLMTEEAIKSLEEEGCFPEGKGRRPHGKTVPRPEVDEVVVFKEFFACGLWIPSTYFLRLVLETFKVQLHHLTPNGILTHSKFCYACETYGTPLDLDTFYTYYELQR